MPNVLFVQPTIYPFDYDKNGNSDRNSKTFAENFNRWTKDVKETLMPSESVMNNRLEEVKQLLKK